MPIHLWMLLVVAWVVATPALATVVGRALRSGGAVPVEASRRPVPSGDLDGVDGSRQLVGTRS